MAGLGMYVKMAEGMRLRAAPAFPIIPSTALDVEYAETAAGGLDGDLA